MSASNILFGFLPSFFRDQLFVTLPKPGQDCTGKTIIVTGANVGLGKEAARHFVGLNAQIVILACRSVEKGEAAKKDIESTTKRAGVVEVWQLDLGSYNSVKVFAERAKSLDRVDTLVENAGISTRTFTLVEDNESTITVNVVSTFLLALLMLPKLQETSKEFKTTPTLSVVSSELQFVTSFPERKASSIFGTLNNKKEARMADRYNVSKLLEVLVSREIARQHPVGQTKVTINFLNPGFCHSELMREMDNFAVAAFKKLFARSTEHGSRALVHGGLSGPETHGQYLNTCKIKPCAPLVEGKDGPDIQRRVWEELAAKLEEIEPGVLELLDAQ